MYITKVPNRKSTPTILLRESYREDGKVKNKTLANLTKWDPDKIEALQQILQGDFSVLEGNPEIGNNFGILFLLQQIAKALGIPKALGKSKKGLLALFLVLARVAKQGSRLSAVKWGQRLSVKESLGLDEFDENDLYESLDWLESQQEQIEIDLFTHYRKRNTQPISLILYDVTSSYFEGIQNDLAEFGYNRDKKKGKKQIVIGLLTDISGEPLAVRVFKGNTSDPSTISKQIDIVKNNFQIQDVVFVGDKGMIRSKGKQAIQEEDWNYITTISKIEIESLIKKEVFQYNLFDEELCEVTYEGKRYILRKNESISKHLKYERNNRIANLQQKIKKRNDYVQKHPKARPEAGLKNLTKLTQDWKLGKFIQLNLNGRDIEINIDEIKQKELFLLDGCVVIETDVKQESMAKKDINTAYSNLHKVESGFRFMKTELLEVRPIFVRKANRTKAHVFVSMLALKMLLYINKKLKNAYGTTKDNKYNFTIEDMLFYLGKINFLKYKKQNNTVIRLPKLEPEQKKLFSVFNCKISDHIV